MKKFILHTFLLTIISFQVVAVEIKNIVISGNNRISDETIILFGDIKINKNYEDRDLNKVIKNLYKTNFFENFKI